VVALFHTLMTARTRPGDTTSNDTALQLLQSGELISGKYIPGDAHQ